MRFMGKFIMVLALFTMLQLHLYWGATNLHDENYLKAGIYILTASFLFGAIVLYVAMFYRTELRNE